MASENTSPTAQPQSPRLTALWSDIQGGDTDALGHFWKEVKEQGTPLIEPIKGDEGHSLVTFLYRADEPVVNVAVISPLGGFNPRHLEPFLMVPLGDTGIWHKTYRARNDLRTTYQLSVNTPLIPLDEVEDWDTYAAGFIIDPLNPNVFVYEKDPDNPADPGRKLSVIELPDAPPQLWIKPGSIYTGEEVDKMDLTELEELIDHALNMEGVSVEDPVRLYLREISRMAPLKSPEESTLVERMAAGRQAEADLELLKSSYDQGNSSLEDLDESRRTLEQQIMLGRTAKERLVQANLYLVVSVARRYIGRGLSLLDLIQEGNIGLMKAADKFDHRSDETFSRYATRGIRQAITQALADTSRTSVLPVHITEMVTKLRRTAHELREQLLREPTEEELGETLNIPPERVRRILDMTRNSHPLDASTEEGEDSFLRDFVEDERTGAPEEEASRQMLKEQMDDIMRNLTDHERQILQRRYGLTDDRPRTLEEIAKEFGITRERIRQIERRMLRKLQQKPNGEGLNVPVEPVRSRRGVPRNPEPSDASSHRRVEPTSAASTGELHVHYLTSKMLGNTRRVHVYTPSGYSEAGQPYPLLILFDGWGYTTYMSAPTTLDNLIAAGRIPPVVALFVDSPDRNLELPCYPPFAEFLAEALVPWADERYAITEDPYRTVVGGASYGGLAATYAALTYPEQFGNVLSQSGAFYWKPEGDPEHEWLARQFASRSQRDLRFYLDAGLYEKWPAPEDGPGILVANRHFRDVLTAKGYPHSYVEYNGGHDDICWRGGLADGLMYLFNPHN